MSPRRHTWAGLGVGLAAAGLTAATGVAAGRLVRARSTAQALETSDSYVETPDEELVVVASDGVVLHVEIDLPSAPPQDVPKGATAPTVVLSHGYTLSLRSWVFQRRALKAAGYRVVLWDLRGHGKSGVGSPDSYDIDQLGNDLARVIAQAAPAGPLVLVGHSMGGMTTMAFAVDHHEVIRERVLGVAFVATSPGGLDETSWGLGPVLGRVAHRVGPLAVGQLRGRQRLVNTALRAGREVEEFIVERYSFASPVPPSIVRLTADMIFGTSIDVISGFMPRFDLHDKREALEQFNGIETLVLNGAEDVLTPPAHSEEIVRLIPGAEHVVVSDAGHIIMLEHPDILSGQLLALIERAMRAEAAQEALRRKPRVTRMLTDYARERLVQRARDEGSRHPSRPARRRSAS